MRAGVFRTGVRASIVSYVFNYQALAKTVMRAVQKHRKLRCLFLYARNRGILEPFNGGG